MYNNKKRIAILLSFIMAFIAAFETLPALNTNAESSSQSARLIVKYKNDVTENSNKVKNRTKQKSKKINNRKINNKVEVLEIEQAENVSDIIQDLENMEEVEYVQEDFELEILGLPSDPELQNQWGIHNIGQEINGSYGTEGNDINITSAWENEYELSEVLVAVLDTGIGINHYDLKSRIDEGGWNFVDDNNQLVYDSVHGTAVAGIIAAEHNCEDITA